MTELMAWLAVLVGLVGIVVMVAAFYLSDRPQVPQRPDIARVVPMERAA